MNGVEKVDSEALCSSYNLLSSDEIISQQVLKNHKETIFLPCAIQWWNSQLLDLVEAKN